MINWGEIKNTPAPFPLHEMGPLQKEAAEKYNQYKPSFLEKVFKNMAAKKWEKLTQAMEEAKKADEATYKKWQQLTELASSVLEGDADAYKQVVKNSNKFDDMRERSTLRVVDAQMVAMDVQVEPKDIVPKKKVQLTKTGRVSKRNMGKKQYYATIKAFVCSHAIWTARCIFASLPVDTCVIHMTETAINTATGHYEQRVLLSVSVDRETMNQLNVSFIDPADAMDNFQHHIDFLITKGFRSVERMTI